jgi:hypothetical protein
LAKRVLAGPRRSHERSHASRFQSKSDRNRRSRAALAPGTFALKSRSGRYPRWFRCSRRLGQRRGHCHRRAAFGPSSFAIRSAYPFALISV